MHVGLAKNDGAGFLQLRHDLRVVLRNEISQNL